MNIEREKVRGKKKEETEEIDEESKLDIKVAEVQRVKVSERIHEERGTEFALPEWVEYPWMYIRPKQEMYLKSWLKSWGDLLVKWAAAHFEHVLSISKISKVYPFSKLGGEDLKEIFAYLVESGVARWRGETSIRIFWKSLEEFADELYDYAIRNGMLEMTPLTIISEGPEELRKMPLDEVLTLFEILVKRGKARWIKKKSVIQIHVP
ncbi:MAG: hypothetical protein ACTSXX_13245 [Candidatus Baldrarchaeia archaeon]